MNTDEFVCKLFLIGFDEGLLSTPQKAIYFTTFFAVIVEEPRITVYYPYPGQTKPIIKTETKNFKSTERAEVLDFIVKTQREGNKSWHVLRN